MVTVYRCYKNIGNNIVFTVICDYYVCFFMWERFIYLYTKIVLIIV